MGMKLLLEGAVIICVFVAIAIALKAFWAVRNR